MRANGCPWTRLTCSHAALGGQLATLRWARENGCPWDVETRDVAAAKLGYTDDFGNLHAEESDDEYSDEYSDDEYSDEYSDDGYSDEYSDDG